MIQDYYTQIKSSDDIVVLSHLLLQNESKKDVQVLNRFSSKVNKGDVTKFPFDALNLDLIYSREQLKSICSKNHFKLIHAADSEVKLTTEEIRLIKDLEEKYNSIITSYYVLTSHDLNDSFSMLFCTLSNGCYFKISEREIPISKFKAIILRSTLSLVVAFVSFVGLLSLVGSFFSFPVLVACVAISTIASLFLLFKKKWHKQITSRTWEQV